MPRSNTMKLKQEWLLDLYVRVCFTKAGEGGKQFQTYDDSDTPLTLTITELQDFVIIQDTAVLESFHLPNCKDFIRGMARTDSLLILYKCQENIRRFRIRFKPFEGNTGQTVCDECVENLSKYFLIKKEAPQSHDMTTAATASSTVNKADVNNCKPTKKIGGTLQASGHSAQCTTHLTQAQPPKQHLPHAGEESIPDLLNTCLSDPNFPAFVAQIERAIIAKEASAGPLLE